MAIETDSVRTSVTFVHPGTNARGGKWEYWIFVS